MTITLTEAAAFQDLFSGRADAYGTGQGGVVRDKVTTQLYLGHLLGEREGIGIFPIRDDGTVRFAAIDLDEKDFSAAALMAELLPGKAWVEQSRSGNAHVWAFFTKPVEAWVARAVLRAAAGAAGYPRAELFPKQDQLQPGMVGNYINLPYHGRERPILSLPEHDGATGFVYPLQQFLAVAHSKRTDADLWRIKAKLLDARPPEQRDRSDFGTGTMHECASYIYERRHEQPLQPGHRNAVLFNLAKQLLNWEGADEVVAWFALKEVNQAGTDPLPESELNRIFANAKRGEYTSTGCDDPLMAPYVRPDCPIANTQPTGGLSV